MGGSVQRSRAVFALVDDEDVVGEEEGEVRVESGILRKFDMLLDPVVESV